MSEWHKIARLREIFEAGLPVPEGALGIGDDAAALAVDGTMVMSVDASVEHVHFERAWLSWDDVGYRATMAALSDLAAMGARPLAVLASLALPSELSTADLEALARGQRSACDEAATRLVGGNLTRASELSIHTTVIGVATRVLRRDQARPGDGVYLAGPIGMAAAGLDGLRREAGSSSGGRVAGRPFEAGIQAECIRAWRRPRALLEEGMRAAEVASAAIDVSDGLAQDVGHLAEASRLRVVLEAEALRHPGLGEAALELALHGGEDYALVATSAVPIPGFRAIGRCEAGSGVWLHNEGKQTQLAPHGWDHFASMH